MPAMQQALLKQYKKEPIFVLRLRGTRGNRFYHPITTVMSHLNLINQFFHRAQLGYSSIDTSCCTSPYLNIVHNDKTP